MPDPIPNTIYLADYIAPAFLVLKVHLTFDLSESETIVCAKISFTRNRDVASSDLVLDGKNLILKSIALNGEALADDQYSLSESNLTLPRSSLPDEEFLLETSVSISPKNNTELEGLYLSKGMYCTQCEAEGFRKITYYPDRPDVMAMFTVRMNSDAPVLLSNGNPTASGPGWAEWHDPWPKPSYLFALVAGDLVAYKDSFTTASGHEVALNIWVRAGDVDRCEYAMGALKRSMIWDEDVYSREYDLDVFNIVAVDDFNMGAMENKGLNIFNSKYVLASPETATDVDFERIEGIIAHEYFHNWTGNRITCRDWFQLCLKEGLTVFRDQQFTGDMRSQPVKRIEDALGLRNRQFREDNGPLSHPVRPESFVEINNFYTATVYDKGAEVIGMLKGLVGDANYSKALNLYFDRHDGDAATIEDWLQVFEDATGRDLSHFSRWYSQAGTPRLTATSDFKDGTFNLHLEQETSPTPGQPDKQPQFIPVAVGLLDRAGKEVVATTVLELEKAKQSFSFKGLESEPIASILRGFSAPVILRQEQSAETTAFLFANDTDPFNKWEAGRILAKDTICEMVNSQTQPSQAYLDALNQVVGDPDLDNAFRALVLNLPQQDEIAQTLADQGHTPDPDEIYRAIKSLRKKIAVQLKENLSALYADLAENGTFTSDAKSAGKRAFRHATLGYLSTIDDGMRAQELFGAANNMTDKIGALSSLLNVGLGKDESAEFYNQWSNDPNVLDKWFAVQISHSAPEKTAETVRKLTQHPDFDLKNPNRFRSVFFPLTMNAAGFHNASGAGYRILTDWLIKLDKINPQTTARLCVAFDTWRRYDENRQTLIQTQLNRIRDLPDLSGDTTEMVDRILKS